MKKIIYIILTVISLFLFLFFSYEFATVKSEYMESVEYINDKREKEGNPDRVTIDTFPYKENMQEYGLTAICFLGLSVLGFKLIKSENKKQNS